MDHKPRELDDLDLDAVAGGKEVALALGGAALAAALSELWKRWKPAQPAKVKK